jgi:DNA polymerase-3 subunit gamma/tau
MAKKKSNRFIVPSFHFLTTVPTPKPPEKKIIQERPAPISQPVVKAALEVETRLNTLEKSKPDPKVVEKPKPLKLPNTARKKSALSLSSLKRDKEEEERLRNKKQTFQDRKDLPNDPFTQETFVRVWTDYIEGLHGKGEKILASILKADAPALKGNHIQLTYPNEMMKMELLKVKPKVLRHLRKALNNYSLDFEIHVNEINTKRFAYTPQEKYELLKEKNAAISFLRKTFNLEL